MLVRITCLLMMSVASCVAPFLVTDVVSTKDIMLRNEDGDIVGFLSGGNEYPYIRLTNQKSKRAILALAGEELTGMFLKLEDRTVVGLLDKPEFSGIHIAGRSGDSGILLIKSVEFGYLGMLMIGTDGEIEYKKIILIDESFSLDEAERNLDEVVEILKDYEDHGYLELKAELDERVRSN